MPNLKQRPVAGPNPPDTLLASQLLDDLTARSPETPERRLMAAVLLDAAVQFSRCGSRGAIEAECWIRGEDAVHSEAFSFEGVCDALGLDAPQLARGLLRWRRMGGSLRRDRRGARVLPQGVA